MNNFMNGLSHAAFAFIVTAFGGTFLVLAAFLGSYLSDAPAVISAHEARSKAVNKNLDKKLRKSTYEEIRKSAEMGMYMTDIASPCQEIQFLQNNGYVLRDAGCDPRDNKKCHCVVSWQR